MQLIWRVTNSSLSSNLQWLKKLLDREFRDYRFRQCIQGSVVFNKTFQALTSFMDNGQSRDRFFKHPIPGLICGIGSAGIFT